MSARRLRLRLRFSARYALRASLLSTLGLSGVGVIGGASGRCRARLGATRSSCRGRARPRSRGPRGLRSATGRLCVWGPGIRTPEKRAGSRRRQGSSAGFHEVLETREGALSVPVGEAFHAYHPGRAVQELALEVELPGVGDYAACAPTRRDVHPAAALDGRGVDPADAVRAVLDHLCLWLELAYWAVEREA